MHDGRIVIVGEWQRFTERIVRARAFGALALTLSALGVLIAVLGVPVAWVAMY